MSGLQTMLILSGFALFVVAPANGQTLTGCRDRETGMAYNLLDTTLRVRPPLDRVGMPPCNKGDAEFSLNLAEPRDSSDSSSANIANICETGFRMSIFTITRDHASAYRFLSYCAERRHGGAAIPEAPRAEFVGSTEITLPGPSKIVGVKSLDLRCTAVFPGSRACTFSDILQGDDTPTELGLVRADSGNGAKFIDAEIDKLDSEGHRSYRYLTCGGWIITDAPRFSGIVLYPSFGLLGWIDPNCINYRMDMACCAPASNSLLRK